MARIASEQSVKDFLKLSAVYLGLDNNDSQDFSGMDSQVLHHSNSDERNTMLYTRFVVE